MIERDLAKEQNSLEKTQLRINLLDHAEKEVKQHIDRVKGAIASKKGDLKSKGDKRERFRNEIGHLKANVKIIRCLLRKRNV